MFENLPALPTKEFIRVVASLQGQRGSSVGLCCVWWGGGRYRGAVCRGHRSGVWFFYHLRLATPPPPRSSGCTITRSLPPLCPRPLFLSVSPTFLTLSFQAFLFSLRSSESSHLLPTLLYFSKFSCCVSLFVSYVRLEESHSFDGPQLSLEITATTVCIRLCFHPLFYKDVCFIWPAFISITIVVFKDLIIENVTQSGSVINKPKH